MKYLILFEDTYGMADLYRLENGLKLEKESVEKDVWKLIKINNEISIMFGLSNSTCINIDNKILDIIDDNKPENVVIVMDLDKGQNDGSGILDYKKVKIKLIRSEKKVHELHKDCIISYIPTIYASETIMLYQYIKRIRGDLCIEVLVHKYNTWRFHLLIIAILEGMGTEDSVKIVRNYANLEILNKSFNDTLDKYPTENREIIEFMLRQRVIGLSLDKFIDKLKHIDEIFNKYKNEDLRFILDGVEISTNERLFDKRNVFKSFPTKKR